MRRIRVVLICLPATFLLPLPPPAVSCLPIFLPPSSRWHQANGYGRDESLADAIKGQTDPEYREVNTPFLPTDGFKRRAQREMNPSNESCRCALVQFFNVIFARQHVQPSVPSPLPPARSLLLPPFVLPCAFSVWLCRADMSHSHCPTAD